MTNHSLKCPVCQEPTTKEVITYINTQTMPELVEQLLDNQLYHFECPHCGAVRQVEVQMIYHDPSNKLLIINLANQQYSETLANNLLNLIPDHLDVSDYNLRLVQNIPELIEKVYISHFNQVSDATMEIIKLLTDGLFIKQKPDADINQRFFTIVNNQPKIYYILESEQFFVDYHESLEVFAKDKLHSPNQSPPKGKFIQIDCDWALHALEK